MKQPVKKLSFRLVYIKYSILMCMIVALVSIATLMNNASTAAPVYELAELFLIALMVALVVGGVFGVVVGSFIYKPLRNMANTVAELERGISAELVQEVNFVEFGVLEESIVRLANKTNEQSLLIQQKTNEYAEEKQGIFEQAIAVERGRLARELHDSVSQQLFAISMMSSAINAGVVDNEALKGQISKLEYMAIQAQSEMRALLLHLRPIQLEGKKLTVGIDELLTELSAKQNLVVEWHLDDVGFEMGVEDHLFRILQEAISNTLRHAKASKLEISLRFYDRLATLKILDDGIGFDMDQRSVGSYGLGTMQERVDEIGGKLKIISQRDVGTQIEIRIPVDGKETDDLE